jgi:hypothetical protein
VWLRPDHGTLLMAARRRPADPGLVDGLLVADRDEQAA